MFSSGFKWTVKASRISLTPSYKISTSTKCSLSPCLNTISTNESNKKVKKCLVDYCWPNKKGLEEAFTLRYWMVVLPRGSRSIFGVNSDDGDFRGVSSAQHGDLDHRHLTVFLWLIHTELRLTKINIRLCGSGSHSCDGKRKHFKESAARCIIAAVGAIL